MTARPLGVVADGARHGAVVRKGWRGGRLAYLVRWEAGGETWERASALTILDWYEEASQ